MSKRTKIVFIINPIAGRKKHSNIEELVLKNLSSDWDPVFVETKKSGHAKELVESYLGKGFTNFIAVGGDGTVSEVATAVFMAGASLGIIPCGSGNGLARSLNIPLSVEGAVNCLNTNKSINIDVGTINNYCFFCTCGVGFDARIGKKFAKNTTRGLRTYIKTILKEFFKYKSKKYKLTIDGESYKRKAFLITIANAGQYGNNVYIAPKAKINDGVLEVCVFKPFPFLLSVIIGIRLFTKRIDRSKYLETISGKSIVLGKKKKYQFHIDGDPVKLQAPICIGIKSKALNIVAPHII